jgi:undecaprenyl-diphosphatase
MEHLNQSLFLLLNASTMPSPPMERLMFFCANTLIWAVPATLVVGWLRAPALSRLNSPGLRASVQWGATRNHFVEAALAGVLGLAVAQVIGAIWPHPRPFALGLGRQWIPHAADPSLPSDHTTLAFCVACSLLLHAGTRLPGLVLALAGIAIGWARVYGGIHFPLDIICGALLGYASAVLATWLAPALVPPALRIAEPVYRRLFAPLIRRGWAVE